MKLEQQVASLELCKKLKELGVKQVSLFYWITSPWNGKSEVIYYEDREQLKNDFIDNRYNLLSAFTASELGEMLSMDDGYTYYSFRTTKSNDSRIYWMSKMSNGEKAHYEEDFTEANARAKMLIYLLENKLITP